MTTSMRKHGSLDEDVEGAHLDADHGVRIWNWEAEG